MRMSMGMKYAIICLMLGFMMKGIFTSGAEQYLNTTQHLYIELAQTDKIKDEEKKEPVLTTEEEKSETKPAKPEKATRQQSEPLKDFVPTEKIPADQAVDFPTDI